MVRNFRHEVLDKLRSMSVRQAVSLLGLYCKQDREFQPVKNKLTVRLHVSVGGQVRELLVTGEKWYDSQKKRGGGGAIDLTMHLLDLDFIAAVKLLSERSEQDESEKP